MTDILPLGDDVFAEADYIRVYQDVRGKYGSEGTYSIFSLMRTIKPGQSPVDDTTDAFDTIDWLVTHIPESNGRVGMIGSSYEGFTVVMALIHPHPALKVAAPESPMVDGWMGDDWFHYGAFRQPTIDYILGQTSKRNEYVHIAHASKDDYANYLQAGAAEDFARAEGVDRLQDWRSVMTHPAYDKFWQQRALDRKLSKRPLTVPTMWVQGFWDQEDMWGAIHCYRAIKAAGTSDTVNHLTVGPWYHGQENRDGTSIGPKHWNMDTAAQWRHEVLLPFFNQYLVENAPDAKTFPIYVFDTGRGEWENPEAFPSRCDTLCAEPLTPLYFGSDRKLSFSAPTQNEDKSFDEYLSDPANPVPYRRRPIDDDDDASWKTWLVADQSFVNGRQDVLTYRTPVLTDDLKLSGEPVANLFASTSGTDSDWIVKLIDVDPRCADEIAGVENCELPIGIEIFRGRYRTSFSNPSPLSPNKPLKYVFPLPMVNHTVKAGHMIEVQVQSSLFPLYDRNPQLFVRNIFRASPSDYHVAHQRVWHQDHLASLIGLPIVRGNRADR
jgi:putative CocE/NonD family hydrolase